MTLGNVQNIMDVFVAMGFPNCSGVIDGSHISILAPDHLATENVNRKGSFSVVIQVLVDLWGHFTDVSVG